MNTFVENEENFSKMVKAGIKIITAGSFIFLLVFQGCFQNQSVSFPEGKAYQKLSEYHLFKGTLANLTPNEKVLPYDLNSPLFTDYAFKKRFVYMPDGSSANYVESEAFEFPKGAILVKNFYYPADFRKPEENIRLLETRLLINRGEKWEALTYLWNDEQSEAELDLAGGITEVSWTHYDGSLKSTEYIIPNANQCKGCHSYKDKFTPIGPKARHLNKDFTYKSGTTNQLVNWQELGFLKNLPENQQEIPVLASYEDKSLDLNDRARAWLDINCAHCHNLNGPGNTSGLFLEAYETNPTTIGINKAPVAAGRAGHGKFDIVPGNPEGSILYHRIKSNDPGVMMPELGRSMYHEEGVELIKNWISAMKTDVGN
ncbi:SO2930 family diheme c-type cytochrome [Flexithrix dorotheae]|uniref:SO2930 family diheme c-type cytochrome n=1 Tax=Flexithrix dorotheae TaxID=70993 RepID=UPI00036E8FB0|nr:SO2930 family diheme c-type cytochrome [Flexithrix dorotheae]